MKNLPAIRDLDARVERILKQHAIISGAAAQVAVAAAIAGLELKALKKECGHGAWEDFFDQHLERRGLKLRTAQNYMSLADGLKGKALKNATDAFLPLLEQAPSELSKADQEKLTNAVAKATDGKTLSELYRDLGIAKKPQGSAAKGGKMAKTTEDTTPATVANTSEIPANVDPCAWKLNQLLEEALQDGWWNDCTEAFRRTLHGNLLDAQTRVAATFKKEKAS